MSSLQNSGPLVKWSFDVQRRGRARKTMNVKVACHREVPLPDGGTDLVRVGTALVTVIGYRTQYVGTVKKRIGALTFTYHVTQPYTDREKCRLACQASVLAGQRFAELWEQADEETRARWAKADRGPARFGGVK